jgi:hypothetical protein
MAKKRPRTERREAQRAAVKLARVRLALAALEPGGSPDRPIEVESASTIETRAASLPCPACEASSTRVEEHEAITVRADSERPSYLRVVHLLCPRCGVRREIYFRIGTALPS